MKRHPIFDEKRWVVWNLEESAGRQTKIPYSTTGKRASSTDPSTWHTLEQVEAAAEYFTGIGVVFTPAETLLGIDIDHVLDEKGKIIPSEHSAAIEKLISEANTYTEISPSGTGLHLYLSLTEGLTLSSNRHSPFEAYTSGRFFTFTKKSYGRTKSIKTITPEKALELLSLIGYPWAKAPTTKSSPNAPVALTETFSDDELTRRMFASKNGAKILSLYDGDLSEYGGDESRADAALLHHLAFWSQKNAEQMERIWLASPLGNRTKTQKRIDYRKRSIHNAIETCKEVYQVPNNGIDFLFTLGAKGEKMYSKNTENVARALDQHSKFAGTLRFDAFKNRIEIRDTFSGSWRAFVDSDSIYLQTQLSILFTFMRTVGKDMVFDAVMKVAKDHTIDSAADFIRSLRWDGTERIDSWLSKTYGTPDDIYHKAVGSNWLKGLVKRIIQPGCKFDYVLVLEGEQGVKKSTSLSILGQMSTGENWHVESTMSTDNKDFFMQLEGKAIAEFSEGETLSRSETKKLKAIITTPVDRYRPSYGRVSEDFPRHCVFAMTTNQDEYLKDETGNRRWLPVRVLLDSADVEWLAANRDQLLAEAYDRVITKGESTWEFPKEETAAQQSARRISDPNTDKIMEWYFNDQFNGGYDARKNDGITVAQVYTYALGGLGQLRKFDEQNIANVLREDLKLIKKRRAINGLQQWRWFDERALSISGILQEELNHELS